MPTFENPIEDADEARQAMRGLAYASRRFDAPLDTYQVLGSLTRTVEAMQQVLEQLSSWHHSHAGHAARDNGDRVAGTADAEGAARSLSRAASALDGVWDELNAAWSHNGTIAWQPTAAPAPSATTSPTPSPAPGSRPRPRANTPMTVSSSTPPPPSDSAIGM